MGKRAQPGDNGSCPSTPALQLARPSPCVSGAFLAGRLFSPVLEPDFLNPTLTARVFVHHGAPPGFHVLNSKPGTITPERVVVKLKCVNVYGTRTCVQHIVSTN